MTLRPCPPFSIPLPVSARPSPRCAHIRFIATLASPDPQLRFLGQTLRGALGFSLKDVACSTPHRDCDRCLLRSACAFHTIFNGNSTLNPHATPSSHATVQPFVLEVAAPGTWWGSPDQLAWGITLFGDEVLHTPYLIAAFARAGERGVGPARTRFTLDSVIDVPSGRQLLTATSTLPPTPIPLVPPNTTSPPPPDGILTWSFHTPVHFTTNGILHRPDDPIRLINAGRRRFEALGGTPAADERHLNPPDFEILDADLHHWRIERYSNRQKQRVPLEGFFGTTRIRGPWSLAGTWLQCASRIHLGKHTTFGLGRVSWAICS